MRKSICVTLVFLIIFLLSCDNTHNKVRKIDLITNMPLVVDGKAKQVIDTFSMLYYKNYKGYQLHVNNFIKTGDSIKIVSISFRYFLYNPDSMFGKLYLDISGSPNRLKVSEFVNENGFNGLKYFNKSNDSLVSTEYSNGKENLLEKYICKKKPDLTYPDTITFHYSDILKDIPYTFSKELENQKKLKIIEMNFLFKSQFYSDVKMVLPMRHFDLKIVESKIDPFINAKLISLFESL